MINAAEARKRTMEVLDQIVNDQLRDIEKLIKEACERGEFFISYGEKIKDEVDYLLDELEYDVEVDENETFISWEFVGEPLNEDVDDFEDDDEVDDGKTIEQLEEEIFGKENAEDDQFETEDDIPVEEASEDEDNQAEHEVLFDDELEDEEKAAEESESKEEAAAETEKKENSDDDDDDGDGSEEDDGK